MAANPLNHHLRVFVRRENRIETVRDTSLANDQREALEQAHPLHLEPRQAKARRELARLVAQQLEGQAQPAHGFALVLGGLRAQAVNECAELLQLLMMIAIRAGLGCAAAS